MPEGCIDVFWIEMIFSNLIFLSSKTRTHVHMEYPITVLGCGGSGKSALIIRFVAAKFVKKYDPTLEDSYRKQIRIDNDTYVLNIRDTAGQQEYEHLRNEYIKTGKGFVFVFSLTSRDSFDYVKKVFTTTKRLTGQSRIAALLVGNKSDLEKDIKISDSEAQKLADFLECDFIKCSAKTNFNVERVFHNITRLMASEKVLSSPKKRSRSCTIL